MQSSAPSFHERRNLSEDLATEIRGRITDGRLEGGSRINEVHLAAELRVSRTPLREALGRLVAETALVVLPRRGFFVHELTVEEFGQVYGMRAILDPTALEMTGVASRPRLERLKTLNRRLLASRDPEQAIRKDDAWHLELLADCPNRILIETIEQFMLRTRRYELAYMRQRKNIRVATDEHEEILSALREGNLRHACEALRRNMQSGKQPILDWLTTRRCPSS
jgi:DNA-binding GntR family transcriptional regulator